MTELFILRKIPMRLFFTTKSEGKRPAQWRKIFIPAFVVEICYLQFPRFGWGFAALCLCASNPTRSVFTQRESFIVSPAQYEEFCPAHQTGAMTSLIFKRARESGSLEITECKLECRLLPLLLRHPSV
jgi:hypothetical protein